MPSVRIPGFLYCSTASGYPAERSLGDCLSAMAMGVSGELCAVEASRPIEVAIWVMGEHDFSQISVTKNGRIIGSLNEARPTRRSSSRGRTQFER
jgi:predicted transcriptional regulator